MHLSTPFFSSPSRSNTIQQKYKTLDTTHISTLHFSHKNAPSPPQENVNTLLTTAYTDLWLARFLFTYFNGVAPSVMDSVMFFSQQSIEKLMKAILLQRRHRQPLIKSHKLDLISKQLEEETKNARDDQRWKPTKGDQDALRGLTPCAIQYRYNWTSSFEKAEAVMKTAEKLWSKLIPLLGTRQSITDTLIKYLAWTTYYGNYPSPVTTDIRKRLEEEEPLQAARKNQEKEARDAYLEEQASLARSA